MLSDGSQPMAHSLQRKLHTIEITRSSVMLFCGCSMCHITRLARPSARLSVCSARASNSKSKRHMKKHNWCERSPGRAGVPSSNLKSQKVKSPDVRNPYRGRTKRWGGLGADCTLGLTVVKFNSLSTSETVGNWTDGRMLRRPSAPTSFYCDMQRPVDVNRQWPLGCKWAAVVDFLQWMRAVSAAMILVSAEPFADRSTIDPSYNVRRNRRQMFPAMTVRRCLVFSNILAPHHSDVPHAE